jgi:hypothetical protein
MTSQQIKTNFAPGTNFAVSKTVGAQLTQDGAFLNALSYSFTGMGLTSLTGTFNSANILNLTSSIGKIGNLTTTSFNSQTGYINNLTSKSITANTITIGTGSFDTIYNTDTTIGSLIASTGYIGSLVADEYVFPMTTTIPNLVVSGVMTGVNACFVNATGGNISANTFKGNSAFFTMITGTNIYSPYLSAGTITGSSAFFSNFTGGHINVSSQIIAPAFTGGLGFFNSITGTELDVTSQISAFSFSGSMGYFTSVTGVNIFGNSAYFGGITGTSGFITSSIETNGLVASGGLCTNNIFAPTGSVIINDIVGESLVIGVNTWNPTGLNAPWPTTTVASVGGNFQKSSYMFHVSDDMRNIGSYSSQAGAIWPSYHYTSKDGGNTWNPCMGTYGSGSYVLNGGVTISKDSLYWIGTRTSTTADGGIYKSINGTNFAQVLSVPMTGVLSGCNFVCCEISGNDKVVLACLNSPGASPSYQIPFYISLNSGNTWKVVVPSSSYDHSLITGTSISYDGKYMAVLDQNGVFFSNDYGNTWDCVGSYMNSLNRRIAMSQDGTHIFVSSMNSSVPYQVSTDFGQTWQQPIQATGFSGIDCDKTGRYVYLINQSGLTYSNNYGSNFSTYGICGTDICVSSDGSKAMVYDGTESLMFNTMTDRSVYTGNVTVNGTVNTQILNVGTLNTDEITPYTSGMVNVSGVKMVNSTILGMRRFSINPSLSIRAVNTWTTESATGSSGFSGASYVCWSPELSLLCAVSPTGVIQTSSDSINWTSTSLAGNWTFVSWSSEMGKFVVCSDNSPVEFAYSLDGTTWTTTNSGIDSSCSDLCYSPELGNFCALSTGNFTGSILSSDGINWTSTSCGMTNMLGLCWSSDLEIYCCVGTSCIMTSEDGISWTSTPVSGTYTSVCWAEDIALFCAVGNNIIATSPDGNTWTTNSSPLNVTWNNVSWSPDLQVLVCISSSGFGYSFNGVTWSSINIPYGGNWKNICWVKELGIFVVVSSGGILISKYVKRF